MSSKYKQLLASLNYIDDAKENNLVQNLLKQPRKDKKFETANTTVPTINYIHQIDLMFLPDDNVIIPDRTKLNTEEFKKVNNMRIKDKLKPFKKQLGYRYVMVVVDCSTGRIDCEPLKYKYSFIVRDALIRLYKRKILTLPYLIEVDSGSEFKDVFEQYFTKVANMRRKKSGRHRAQAVVESVNSILSEIIQTRMIAQEINTNESSKEWVEELPKIIQEYNKHFEHKPPSINPETDIPIRVKENSNASIILEIGTKVRSQLDNPITATTDSRRLHGAFRKGDIRWKREISTITQVFLRPSQPPMYQVDNDMNVAYTKNQLQVVNEQTEKAPNVTVQKRFIIKQILERFKLKNKVFFKVLYDDGDKIDIPRSQLFEDVPEMVKDFEKKN
jgi:hypothetical protein